MVCTYGRPDKQITWDSLPKEIRLRACLVVQDREAGKYPGLPTLVLPPTIKNLPDTRQWLRDNTGPKVVQLDDDLVFATRRADVPTKFRPAMNIEIIKMFDAIEYALDSYAHVGVSHREGANRNTEPYIQVGRMMRILGYRTDVLRKENIVHNRIPDMEDFDVTLQLLRKGYPNLILNNWVHNQGGSNTEGGCSDYRTMETHARDCHILAEKLHPGFVKAVEKTTKTSWGGTTRTDVRMSWKKAYESAGHMALVPKL